MSQRIALVTGGVGGLGTSFCRALAQAGCRVIAADRNDDPETLEAWRNALGPDAGACTFQRVDVSDFDNCRQVVGAIEDEYGGVDILVNAAGVTRDVTLKKMQPEQWQTVMRINLDGAFNMSRQVVGGMCERGYGRIVNISSVNGQTGQFGQTNYAAAKAGMHGFTMALAREVAAKGVTVNSVSPGYCATRLMETIPDKVREKIVGAIPVGRLAEPAEIARVVAFLADEKSAYITGANVPVNGGYFLSF